MLLSDIYKIAAALISEQPDGADNTDLADRAVYLLYQIVSELVPLDRAVSGEDRTYPDSLSSMSSLDDPFPLCNALAYISAYKLAYLLISDENTVLYTVLRTEYENAKKHFIDSLSADISGIVNVYP